jgi:Glycosyl hydrolases family 28
MVTTTTTTMMMIILKWLTTLLLLISMKTVYGQRILSIEDYGAIADDHDSSEDSRWMDLYDLSGLTQQQEHQQHATKSQYHDNLDRITKEISDKYKYDDDQLLMLARNNTMAFNRAIQYAQVHDTVLVPDGKSFVLIGGVLADSKHGVVFDFAGSVHFIHDTQHWPIYWSKSTFHFEYSYASAFEFFNCTDIVLTCSSTTKAKTSVDYKHNEVHLIDADTHRGGLINGFGKLWWDDVIAGRIHEKEQSRPRLIHIIESEDVLVEKLTLINSPYWSLTIEAVRGEVRETNVLIDRQLQADLFAKYDDNVSMSSSSSSGFSGDPKEQQRRRNVLQGKVKNHNNETTSYNNNTASTSVVDAVDFEFPIPIDDLPDWIGRKFRQPQDLNTDGVDAYGQDIWIHDCIISNADDSISIKPSNERYPGNITRLPNCTSNITMSNLVLTGFGAAVGSVGPTITHNCVDNIKFINISMPGTGKGIYVKSNPSNCSIGQTSQISNILYENIEIIEPFWWAIWIGPQQQHQPNNGLGMKVRECQLCVKF